MHARLQKRVQGTILNIFLYFQQQFEVRPRLCPAAETDVKIKPKKVYCPFVFSIFRLYYIILYSRYCSQLLNRDRNSLKRIIATSKLRKTYLYQSHLFNFQYSFTLDIISIHS